MSQPATRYRRRGGAKKKKKPRTESTTLSDNPTSAHDDEQPASQPPQFTPADGPSNDAYFSGLGSGASAPTFVEQQGQSYPSAGDAGPGGPDLSGATVLTSYAQVTLDPDTESYLQKIQESLDEMQNGGAPEGDGFSDPNDLDGPNPSPATLLARNALAGLQGRLAEVSRHGTGCRLVERLLPHAGASHTAELLRDVAAGGARQFASLAMHRTASHLLQKTLELAPAVCASVVADIMPQWDADIITQLMRSSSATHVVRNALAALARIPSDEPPKLRISDDGPPVRYFDTRSEEPTQTDCECIAQVVDIVAQQLGTGALDDMPYSHAASGALQALLSATAVCDAEALVRLVNAIVTQGGESDTPADDEQYTKVENMMIDRCASRLIDRVILVCSGGKDKDTMPDDITRVLRDDTKLLFYVNHPIGNHCVQRYMAGLRERGEVARVARALDDAVQTRLLRAPSREGVVLALARAVERVADAPLQSTLARSIARGVDAVDKDSRLLAGHLLLRGQVLWAEWARRAADLTADDLLSSYKGPDGVRVAFLSARKLAHASTIGALLARCVLRMHERAAQGVRASLAALPPRLLALLCADASASRVVEEWVRSSGTGSEKVANRVALLLLNAERALGAGISLDAVCRSPNASMVLVAAAERASAQVRKKVLDALAARYDELRSDRFAQVLLRKCRVAHYMARADEWDKKESGLEARRRMFADILEDDDDDDDDDDDEEEQKDEEQDGGRRKNKNKTDKSKKRKIEPVELEDQESGDKERKGKKKKRDASLPDGGKLKKRKVRTSDELPDPKQGQTVKGDEDAEETPQKKPKKKVKKKKTRKDGIEA